MKKLRVLIVDDEIMIREGFKRLFDWEAHGCEVVGEAADGMEALARIDALRPDIVIVWGSRLYNNLPQGGLQGDDLKAPDGRWVETWRYFLSDRKEVKVVPIMHPSSSFSPEYWHQFLSAII